MTWLVAKTTFLERCTLQDAGIQVHLLPAPVARHFVAPLQLHAGEKVAAVEVKAEMSYLIDVSNAVMARTEDVPDVTTS